MSRKGSKASLKETNVDGGFGFGDPDPKKTAEGEGEELPPYDPDTDEDIFDEDRRLGIRTRLGRGDKSTTTAREVKEGEAQARGTVIAFEPGRPRSRQSKGYVPIHTAKCDDKPGRTIFAMDIPALSPKDNDGRFVPETRVVINKCSNAGAQLCVERYSPGKDRFGTDFEEHKVCIDRMSVDSFNVSQIYHVSVDMVTKSTYSTLLEDTTTGDDGITYKKMVRPCAPCPMKGNDIGPGCKGTWCGLLNPFCLAGWSRVSKERRKKCCPWNCFPNPKSFMGKYFGGECGYCSGDGTTCPAITTDDKLPCCVRGEDAKKGHTLPWCGCCCCYAQVALDGKFSQTDLIKDAHDMQSWVTLRLYMKDSVPADTYHDLGHAQNAAGGIWGSHNQSWNDRPSRSSILGGGFGASKAVGGIVPIEFKWCVRSVGKPETDLAYFASPKVNEECVDKSSTARTLQNILHHMNSA